MVRFAFKKGLRFLQNMRAYTLIRRLANGNFQVEDQAGEFSNLTEAQMHTNWSTGIWQIDEESLGASSNVFYFTTPKDLKALPEKDQLEIKRKLEYVRGTKKLFEEEGTQFLSSPEMLKPKIASIAKEIKDATPPSHDSVWRWWKRFKTTQCVVKLRNARWNAGRRHDATQRSIFEEAISEVFLTPQKKPGKEVVESVARKVLRINQGVPKEQLMETPSQATIYRWLKNLHYQVVQNARQGKSATDRELRSVIGGVKVKRILERVELDHTPLDLMVICKLTRMILGRPWLTLAIDRKSRTIMGFYISFHAPSATSVLYCLRMMIMPKEQVLARFPDVRNPWPARGIPESIATDNGMELHANAVEAICLEIGTILHYCGVAFPEMKGCIERAIGTVNRYLIHTLPGTTFSNVFERGDYDSESHAAIDLEDLTHIIVKWIVDVYHNTPHRGLGGHTPLAVWQEDEKNCVIELPAFPRQLDTLVGSEATRTLFHYGLEYDNLRYNSPLLQAITTRVGGTPQLKLRAFEHDVGYIAVFHPELDEFVDIPAVDQDYASGLNRYVHQLVCGEVRKRFGNAWNNEQLLLAKSEIQAIVDEAIHAKKAGTRKKAAANLLTDSEQVIAGQENDRLQRALTSIDTTPKPLVELDSGFGDDLPVFNKSLKLEEVQL